MSMTTELIDKLRGQASLLDEVDNLAIKSIKSSLKEAADTIEELSAKLHAANMERTSMYYHGGWVPVDERLPEKNGVYLISYEDAVALMEFFNGKWFLYQRQPAEEAGTILAWRPLPTEYRGE